MFPLDLIKYPRKFSFLSTSGKFLTSNRRIKFIKIRANHSSSRSRSWSILFFGTDNFAVESLQKLHTKYNSQNAIKKLEVVVLPTAIENSVKKYAEKYNIKTHTWPLKSQPSNFDLGVVVSFGRLIPTSIIQSFPFLLPKWRGAAPINHAIINGDVETGVTVVKLMPKKYDIGDIIDQKKTPIHPDETFPQLCDRLAKIGSDLLLSTVQRLPDILLLARPQRVEDVTYAPKLYPQMSIINWDAMSAKNIYNLQRGLLNVYPLTTYFEANIIKLYNINLAETPKIQTPNEKPGFVIYSRKRKLLLVKCKDGQWISVSNITVPGRRVMNALDFYNGYIAGRQKKSTCFNSNVNEIQKESICSVK
ncbi:methionyl-tRNA formyltransferase, mitochondrial isoform X2 [Prorops nasuta]|uniref:methionyl-tRNA formyltransferase, mitochondrial isoform X2 n=1 Tax=Prorops nasuta TaxID=863751 RepID=UPI0034CE5809